MDIVLKISKLTFVFISIYFCIGIASAESEHLVEASCPAAEKLSGSMTPVDLYSLLPACINKADYQTAVLVFGLAGIYGKFDTMRVADVTSHQAVGFLKRLALDSSQPIQKNAFQKEAGETFDDINRRASLCESINKIGAPTYFPKYMILHGLNAVNGSNLSNNGLVVPFDAVTAWQQSLTSYLHCN